MKILVTGGAGFIGSHIVDALVERGYKVRVLDNLEPQVHGQGNQPPSYLNPEAEFIQGDVCNRDALLAAFKDVQAVFYQAARVGVGQSMYEVRRYVEANTLGAANLLDILANERCRVEKIVVASSMSVYGEGAYECDSCGPVYPSNRFQEQMARRQWEMLCPHCSEAAHPVHTREDKPLYPASIYAITKRDHEEMFLCIGRAYRIPTVALRYFNVYGPRQALSNPYTGVAAIFSARILNQSPPVVYEDGLQSRDFVHVSDIVQANLLALEKEEANYEVFNVGTGQPVTILEVARLLSEHLGFNAPPEVTHRYREGDIRHCFADITKIRQKLGYEPKVTFAEGVKELVEWVSGQMAKDRVEEAESQLSQRGLVR